MIPTSAWAPAILLVFLSACDEKKPPPGEPSTPPPALSALEGLGLDAGDPLDPPAPAGDLKADLDRFVNVDTCVAERAKLDPLVGDALGALGYETFLRDACRLLEAAKDRKRETCDRIDSSALRARCQVWVAIVAQTPDGCPMEFEGLVTRGRSASCVAVAAKDPRLCAGEVRTIPRATCEAMVTRDPARCDPLLPRHRLLCQREVARWRSVLAPPLEGLPPMPPARGKLVVRGTSGTPDPPQPEVDLSTDFARGVVLVTARDAGRYAASEIVDRARIELGTVVESEAARIAAGPLRRARLGLALILEPGKKDAPRAATLQKLELDLPGEPPLVAPPASCDCKVTTVRVPALRGAEAFARVEGTLTGAGRTYRVTAEVTTWVRDVVAEGEGSRVLPLVHPPLGGVRSLRDAGK